MLNTGLDLDCNAVIRQLSQLLAMITGSRLLAKRVESGSGVKWNSPDRQATAYSV